MSKYIVGSENSSDKFEFNSLNELYDFLCATLPDYEAASICRWVEKMKPGEQLQNPVRIPLLPGLACSPSFHIIIFHNGITSKYRGTKPARRL